MEPAPHLGTLLESSPKTPDPIPPAPQATTTPPRKTRSDAKLEQLSPARRERLRVWLEDENRSYAEVVHLLYAEFNLTVGKSAVALYWRRHLLPERHAEEAEIAATLAALPSADFDTATLNQARALAWTALTRQTPQIQDAARLLNLLHRAERLSLSRQRLTLEERRLALREAESGSAPPRPKTPAPSAPARHQPTEPRLPLRSLGEGGPLSPEPSPPTTPPEPPTTPQHHPTFPGYSALFPPRDLQPSASPSSEPSTAIECTLVAETPPRSSFSSLPSVQIPQFEDPSFRLSCFSCLSWFQQFRQFEPPPPAIPLPCLPCVPWAPSSVPSVPPPWPLCPSSISSSFPSLPPVQFPPFEDAPFRLSCFSCISWFPLHFSAFTKAFAAHETVPQRGGLMSAESTGSDAAPAPAAPAPSDFIRDIVAQDVAAQRYPKIVTRFPPEPNGYLHIGHTKSICLNFGIARENNGQCNLRMDDTNPTKEETEYVDSIVADVRWLIDGWADHCLGFKPKGAHPQPQTVNGQDDRYLPPTSADAANTEPFFASDYFEELYAYAVALIRKGKAYVCDLSPKETEEYRGAPDKPGRDSPFRNRSVVENIDLFQRMRAGEFPDGARTLRAKIDMTAPNIWLRDPLLYRIRHAAHHHAGDKWRIYPLYDYAHCLSDYLEGVTHSVCTLEFEVHRPLYDWILQSLDLPRALPHQYEFAKLIPTYTLVSKRKLIQLVQEKLVAGWDDPRLPTVSGLRRRGIRASAIRAFAYNIGVTKYDSVTDIAVFEHAIREDLNAVAHRRLAVLRPIKLVLTNIPAGETIECAATNNPQDENSTTRQIALTREVFIESEDFAEVPPPKYFRLKPGGEVRLKYACIIKLDEIVKDASGAITELRCTADLTTRAGGPNVDRKVKGTIHWVSATQCVDAEVRLYDRLFTVAEPGAEEDFKKFINPHSLETVTAKLETSLATADAKESYQFERLGYFTLDAKDSTPGKPIFNRTISLKDTWAKK